MNAPQNAPQVRAARIHSNRLRASGAAASLLSLALLLACGKKEDGAEKAGASGAPGANGAAAAGDTTAVAVVVSKVEVRPFEDWQTYSADLAGVEDVTLSAGGGGRVNQVNEVGGRVKAGAALCNIESDRYQAMFLQAKAALDVAKGELDRTKVNVEKGSLGRAAIDQVELGFQSARVAYLQAKRAYDDSRCLAPFSGVLVSRHVERFQTVPPGAPTVRVARTDRLKATIAIPESESPRYKEGLRVQFFLSQAGGAEQVYEGKLKSLERAVESRNRTVSATVEFPNEGGELKPGMVGKARILSKTLPEAVLVPSQAVLRLQEGTAVMVARDGVARKVPVTLGSASGDSVLVESGLGAGENLIVTGAFKVSDGTRVRF